MLLIQRTIVYTQKAKACSHFGQNFIKMDFLILSKRMGRIVMEKSGQLAPNRLELIFEMRKVMLKR